MRNKTLTALKGVKVGHSTHPEKLTGCTVVIFEGVYPVAYASSGGSPGTVATEDLNDGKDFGVRDGLFIAGGSMNGLAAYATIARELIEQGRGFKIDKTSMPLLAGAIVYDLSVGNCQFDPEFGAEALANAGDRPVVGGNQGAGTGTSVGKFRRLGEDRKTGAMKAGVGSARVDLANGAMVCALSIVNAMGNIVNRDGSILAGNRDGKGGFETFRDVAGFGVDNGSNTTISIVGTNAKLRDREDYRRIAAMAAQGQIRAIQPVNLSLDGDTVFVFSTETVDQPLNANKKLFETEGWWPGFSVDIIGNVAADAVRDSIYDAVKQAETIKFAGAYLGIIPAATDTV